MTEEERKRDDKEFMDALAMWREAAIEAAEAKCHADLEGAVLLLESQGKNAECRKAEAEIGSKDARLSAVLAAIPAQACRLKVEYLIARAKGGILE